jgi:hypothetical protein
VVSGFEDYSTVLTLGMTGTFAVTYLGCCKMTYTATRVASNSLRLTIEISNNTTLASALRPPFAGYLPGWQRYVDPAINSAVRAVVGINGPMHASSQTFRWSEVVSCQ